MHVFQELELKLKDIDVSIWIDALEKNASGGWHRYLQQERIVRSATSDPRPVFCFLLNTPPTPTRWLFLQETEKNRLTVVNVLVPDKGNLNPQEYNAVLSDFVQNVVRPANAGMGNKVEVRMSPAEIRLEDQVPASILERLRQFSSVSSKGSGRIDPMERRKWLEFLAECHRLNFEFDRQLLRQWLVQEGGWPDYAASELMGEFDFARSLLETYDHKRAS
jgi:hypothetical protein